VTIYARDKSKGFIPLAVGRLILQTSWSMPSSAFNYFRAV